MLSFPNAKINIGLNITEKRTDGYHNLESVFFPIGLSDILEFIPQEEGKKYDEFGSTGLAINCKPEDNLCMKSLKTIRELTGIPFLKIHLHKIIPFGAGLGGGSADAAFFIKNLNTYYNSKLSIEELKKHSLNIGSDCPFFIENTPCFASGRGEIIENIDLSIKDHFLILIHPGFEVNTREAYAGIKPSKPEISVKELIKRPIPEWKYSINNDFETSVFQKFPKIKEIKENLYRSGAIYASMSGSGSSVYGIFREDIDLKNEFENYFIWKERL